MKFGWRNSESEEQLRDMEPEQLKGGEGRPEMRKEGRDRLEALQAEMLGGREEKLGVEGCLDSEQDYNEKIPDGETLPDMLAR